MNEEERNDFIDLVAQAVVDKIEKKDQVEGLVVLVAKKVIELQKEAKDLEAAVDAEINGTTTEPSDEEAA